MDLDSLYGVAMLPAGRGMREWESSKQPKSLLRKELASSDEPASILLLEFMRRAQDGCAVSRYLFLSVKLLWILDQKANLCLAVEEASNPDLDTSIPILTLNPQGAQAWQKLGHPSMLPPPHRGRIGGELILRPATDGVGFWELNNSPGRYGLNCGRTELQLNAAAERFTAAGVRIDIDFQGI